LLRRIFGPKRDEVIGGWRKLHYEELHNLYFSPKYNLNDPGQGGRDGQGVYHEWRLSGIHVGFWWDRQNERDHYEGIEIAG
jgi:hypothetical protein